VPASASRCPRGLPRTPVDPTVVTRQSLAEVAAPPGAPKRTLGLSKVVVMPGAVLASHHHPGEQLGYVAEGVLTYTVETGYARLMTGPGDDATLVRKIKPGQTVRVKPGQWLVEGAGRGPPRPQRRHGPDRHLHRHAAAYRRTGRHSRLTSLTAGRGGTKSRHETR
jgi:hypothetical protein